MGHLPRRTRNMAVSGLSASLAALVVLATHGAGAFPLISLGGLALSACVFAWIVLDPTRFAPELPAARHPAALPPGSPKRPPS